MTTIKELIESALPYAGLPSSPVQTDVLEVALAAVNYNGLRIWQEWPWENEKQDWQEVTPDADGVVTLPSDVDVVRAVRTADPGNAADPGTVLLNQDSVVAALKGNTDCTAHFEHLSDATDGSRRIKVDADLDTVLYVLALKRFVRYSLTNYTTAKYPIDRAEEALRQYVIDDLRKWAGLPTFGDGNAAMAAAINREKNHSQKQMQIVPVNGMFSDADYML
ncbi:MAG: hypothetical protein EOM20_03300 [Spartobacteria bacterium]|nr:hypothetical protein [Spartobacteria bacterium]